MTQYWDASHGHLIWVSKSPYFLRDSTVLEVSSNYKKQCEMNDWKSSHLLVFPGIKKEKSDDSNNMHKY